MCGQMRGFSKLIACAMCLLVMGVGCMTTPYRAGAAVDDDVTMAALRASMAGQYPDQFRVVQRAVLTVRKRQFNLDGYLLIDRSEGFRFLATSGFGMTMFEWNVVLMARLNFLLYNDLRITCRPGDRKAESAGRRNRAVRPMFLTFQTG